GLVCPAFALYVITGADGPTEAADAKQRAAQAKDPSIRIALEHEAAFWLLLAEQMDWIDKGRSIPSATKGVSLSLYRHSCEYIPLSSVVAAYAQGVGGCRGWPWPR